MKLNLRYNGIAFGYVILCKVRKEAHDCLVCTSTAKWVGNSGGNDEDSILSFTLSR